MLAPVGYIAIFGAVLVNQAAVGESLVPNLQNVNSSPEKTVMMVVNALYDPARPNMSVNGVIAGSDPVLKDEAVIVPGRYVE